MLTKIFQHLWLKLLVIPYILFFVLVFSYGSYSKTIPISFWDEIRWVGRSYFFEFFIHGNFDNRIWQLRESYDQPKLAEYAYGAWLYPLYLYLKDRSISPQPFGYTRFLINNGFYEIDEKYMDTYADYKNNSKVIRFDYRMSGFPEEWVAKYGESSLKSVNLIYRARILNTFLLAGAVIFAYFLALEYGGVIFALIFSIFYGYNSLIIATGLKAHSEALFLFTFNAAFLFMNLYFIKGRKILYLLLFSLFAGLCISTKINGSMLVVIFVVLNLLQFFFSKEKKIEHILLSFIPLLISLIVFVSLNPFTYPDPLKNVQYMFDWRMKTAFVYQADRFKENLLPDNITRIRRVFENFYFSENAAYFNGVKIFEQINSLKNYGIYLFVLFFLGLFYSLKLAFQKNQVAITILSSLALVLAFMTYYLILDWERYYAHLPLFFVILQSFGMLFIIKYAYKYSKLLAERAINRALKK